MSPAYALSWLSPSFTPTSATAVPADCTEKLLFAALGSGVLEVIETALFTAPPPLGLSVMPTVTVPVAPGARSVSRHSRVPIAVGAHVPPLTLLNVAVGGMTSVSSRSRATDGPALVTVTV